MMQPYILTHSGRKVGRLIGVPSLVDLAVGMSRQPRFGGQTRRWWSVLDHSLFIEALVHDSAQGSQPLIRELRLAALLHDAHEAITGDMPSPLKTADVRALQAELDVRIMDTYFPGGWLAYEALHAAVREFDTRALIAEGHVFGPMPLHSLSEATSHFGREPDARAVELLETGNFTTDPYELRSGERARNVRRFIAKYAELR